MGTLGGSITATSLPDQGAVLRIAMPRAAAGVEVPLQVPLTVPALQAETEAATA